MSARLDGGGSERERFVVAITHGWNGDEPAQYYRDYKPRTEVVPLSASVLDRLYSFEAVVTYRSDMADWPFTASVRFRERLNADAIALAEAKARELNDAERAMAAA